MFTAYGLTSTILSYVHLSLENIVVTWMRFLIMIILNVGGFVVPLAGLFAYFRKHLSNHASKLVVLGWFFLYLSLYVLFPAREVT